MPINVARLQEYIRVYDVDLDASWVAMDGKIIFGLGMLGVRSGRAWITRVGVLPIGRRQGTGRAIVDQLVESAGRRGCQEVWIEVIVGNEPARQLFITGGFQSTRELLVGRRPPSHTSALSAQALSSGPQVTVSELNHFRILDHLARRTERANWLNETESFGNSDHTRGLLVDIRSGGRGWVAYKAGEFQLSHVLVEILAGEPAQVTSAVLKALHRSHESKDTVMENLPVDSPCWQGFLSVGYFEVFRRLEMVKLIC